MNRGKKSNTQKFTFFHNYLCIIHENICINSQNIQIIENQYSPEHILLEDYQRVLNWDWIIVFHTIYYNFFLYIALQLEMREHWNQVYIILHGCKSHNRCILYYRGKLVGANCSMWVTMVLLGGLGKIDLFVKNVIIIKQGKIIL